jgi:hypothetical protein
MMAVALPATIKLQPGHKLWLDVCSEDYIVRSIRAAVRLIGNDGRTPIALFALYPETASKAQQLMTMFIELVRAKDLKPPPTRIAAEENIRDVGRIQSTMLALRATAAPAHLSVQSAIEDNTLRIVDIKTGAMPLVWQTQGLRRPLQSPFVLEVSGYNSVYSVPINRFRLDGNHLISEMPAWIQRLRHRWHRRTKSNRSLHVQFMHPIWPQIRIHAPIFDVSLHGFSTTLDAIQNVLYPGLALPKVFISEEDRVIVQGPAYVRSIVLGQPNRLGLEFGLNDHQSRIRWERLVSDMLHPSTMPGHRLLESTWSTYSDSGYFNLSGKSPEYFKRLRSAYYRTSARLAHAPNLSSHAVWTDNGEASATISMVKSHDHTWLVFQLARARKLSQSIPAGRILRELYFRCYEDAGRDPELRWLLAYVQTSAHWSRVVHYDLVRQYELENPSLAHTHRFRAIEVDTMFPRSFQTRPVQIAEATHLDLRKVHRAALAKYGAVWVDALDLVEDRMFCPSSKTAFEHVGLSRARAIFVAKQRGQALAAIICDTMTEGIHLFGLLDTARIIPLSNGHPSSEIVYSLISAAAAWFHKYDKRIYVLLDDHDYLDVSASTYFEDMGFADQTILSARALPEMLEYVQSKTHPREWSRVLEEESDEEC